MGAADTYDEAGLRSAGFSDDEIAQDKAEVGQHLSAAGFSNDEVNSYFGAKNPDVSGAQKYVEANLAQYKASKNVPGTTPTTPQDPTPQDSPRPAEGFLDALKAGWQMSVSGLITRHQMPDTVLPEDAPMGMKIAMQTVQLAGDVPAMAAGMAAGGAAGSEVPVIGNAIGAAAGAWAAPAAIRSLYIDQIKKGNVQDFGDLWARASSATWEGIKGAVTGAATEGMGGLAAQGLSAAPAISQVAGKTAAQLAAMTTVGKAMEGQMPKAEDFTNGAVMLLGFHALGSGLENVTSKIQDIYAKTGMRPEDVVTEAQNNPVLKQQLLSSTDQIPKILDPLTEDPQPNQHLIDGHSVTMVDAEVPPALNEKSNVLGEGFSPDQTPQVPKPPEPSKDIEQNTPTTPDPNHANATILSRIGDQQDEGSKFSWNDLRTKVLDDMNPVAQLSKELAGGEKIPANEDPNVLGRLARASSGMAETFIDNGPRDFETREKTGTPGLKQIFSPFKGDMDGFRAYAVASRAVELEGRGIETGVPLDAAQKVVESGKDKYEEGFQKLVNFQNDTLSYLKDSGVISQDTFDQSTKQNQRYIPFNRIQEDGSPSGGKSSINPIKQIFGSDLKLQDPIESIIKNTFAYTKLAEENRAKNSLVTLAENSDLGKELVQKVPTTIKPIEVSKEEVAKFMNDNGIQGDPASFDIFRPLSLPLGKDEIAVMNDGKREVYNVGEPVATALKGTGYQDAGMIMKALSIPAKMVRAGIETPDFFVKHLIRDQANAFVNSRNGYIPFLDTIQGLKSYFTEDSNYQDWLASGGGMANVVSMDRDYIQSKIFDLSKETGLIDKTMNVLKNPLQIAQAAMEAITSAPRLGEFAKAQEAGKSMEQSAYDSRNVTVDNQRMGAQTRGLSMITAFWNTHVQGVDNMVRSFQENPAGTAAKMALGITLPSILTWYANKDDPRVQDLPSWQKDLFWIVATKDNIYRIPKPFEQGVLFGSLVERTLDAYYAHNPDAFKGFLTAVTDGAVPNPIPNSVMPAVEQFANHSWLTGANIVPHTLEGVAPQYQYNPYTSEAAKQIGKMISYVPGVRDIGHGNETLASPMIIQNYVRAWGGGMGMYALQLADKALSASGVTSPPPQPTSALADIPVIKSFVVRYPSAASQNIQDFYDNFQKAQTRMNTIQHLVKSGDMKSAYDYMNSPEAQEGMTNLSGIEKALSVQNRTIQLIHSNPDMNPDEKRQQIDGIYYQMIEQAKLGNQITRQMEKH